MNTQLSVAARELLRLYLTTNDNRVDDHNRGAYRELVRVGFMMPLHTPLGRESACRMTKEGGGFLFHRWLVD
jgi:hypothetical protein